MNEIGEKGIDNPNTGELSMDDLNAVNGGSKFSDVIDRIVAIYHFVTGTITSHATTLP